MIWRLLHSIKGVYGGVQINSNWLSYFLKDHTFCIRDIQDYDIKKEIKIESDLTYKVFEDDFYFFGYGTLYRLNLETPELTELIKTDKQYIEALSDNLFLASSYSRKTKLHESQLLNSEGTKWEFFGVLGFRKHFGDVLIFSTNSDDQISKVDIHIGEESWTYAFPDGEKVQGDIYLYEDILIVPLTAGQMLNNKNYLQGIDVNTGKEIWKKESYFFYLQQNSQTGLLYGFAGEKYQVIHPITGNKLVDKEFSGLKGEKKLQVYQGMSRLYGNGLYFISDYVENHYDCQFGKINTDTHEIEFIQKMDVVEGVKVDPPIYHKGRLYIKDNLGTLHIFEQG